MSPSCTTACKALFHLVSVPANDPEYQQEELTIPVPPQLPAANPGDDRFSTSLGDFLDLDLNGKRTWRSTVVAGSSKRISKSKMKAADETDGSSDNLSPEDCNEHLKKGATLDSTSEVESSI